MNFTRSAKPLINTGLGMYPLRNVANSENILENLTFTLATKQKSSRKITNSKYDPIDSEMNQCLGELKAAKLVKVSKIGKVPYECIPAYLISFVAEDSNAEILRGLKDFFSEINEINPKIKSILSQRFKVGEISEHIFSNFPENWQN